MRHTSLGEEQRCGPLIPPNRSSRPIRSLPTELLSRIFQLGVVENFYENVQDPKIKVNQARDEPRQIALGNVDDRGTAGDEGSIRMGVDEGTEDVNLADDVEHIGRPSSDVHLLLQLFLILVSHVCQHWRNLAISTPSLWTSISISPISRPPYQHLAIFLTRSKCLRLDIRIRLGSQERGVRRKIESTLSMAETKLLFSLLVVHVHRWRSIDVGAVSNQQMHAFLEAVCDSTVTAAPQLVLLALSASDDRAFRSLITASSFTPFGGSIPSLSSITLGRVLVDWNQGWICAASRLTTLELWGHSDNMSPSWDELVTILRGAPALERLVLQESGPPGAPPTITIQLVKLKHLSLSFQSQVCACGLLRMLYMPAVRSLYIAFLWKSYTEFFACATAPPPISALSSIEEPPRSLLHGIETIEVMCPFYGAEDVESLYDELENVTWLVISMDDFWWENSGCAFVLPLLPRAVEEDDGAVRPRLPRLKTLSVIYATTDIHLLVLRYVVQRRRAAGFPIRSVDVKSTCELEEEDAAWFVANLETFAFSRLDAGE
ncbi:hypothetical protein JVT61DRAFT_11739 [Boletus reticuloceps]|uniref:F-box domain-containing protein n=1 Tax=Boletus reticuloceps TaxID=495285 RepID=A0A8I2YU09_9AGAM|nr:hypothetical protein JVT61DRAFT_11739 [Boletus reticuloceps]